MEKKTRRGVGKIPRLEKEIDKEEVWEKEEKGNGSNKKGNKSVMPPLCQRQGWLMQPRVWLCAYCPVGFLMVQHTPPSSWDNTHDPRITACSFQSLLPEGVLLPSLRFPPNTPISILQNPASGLAHPSKPLWTTTAFSDFWNTLKTIDCFRIWPSLDILQFKLLISQMRGTGAHGREEFAQGHQLHVTVPEIIPVPLRSTWLACIVQADCMSLSLACHTHEPGPGPPWLLGHLLLVTQCCTCRCSINDWLRTNELFLCI